MCNPLVWANGEDIILSPAAEAVFNYSVECKNTERLNVWAALEQSCGNAPRGKIPILAIRKNRHTPYAVIPWNHFIELVGGSGYAKENVAQLASCDGHEDTSGGGEGKDVVNVNSSDTGPGGEHGSGDGEPPHKKYKAFDDDQWLSELRECADRMHSLLHCRE